MQQQLDGTLWSYFDVLYRRQRLTGRSPGTTAKFRAAIMKHLAGSLGHVPLLADLSDVAILDCMDWMLRQGYPEVTCNSTRSKLVALWNFLARKGVIGTWPDVQKLVEPELIPVCWLPDELGRLFAACRAAEGWIGDRSAADWWVGLHCVLYDTGERIGAVMRLIWQDIDLASGWVTFQAKNRKGRRKALMRRLHADSLAVLAPARGSSPQERVFPWPRDVSRLWTFYARVLKAAGLPADRRHMFHCLRRTHASFLEAAKAGAATASLGHSSPEVTARYLDPRVVQPPQPVDTLRRPCG